MGEKRAIVVPHTHWDREWYLTFQEYRYRLLKVMDKAIELLVGGSGFSHFMLDGQVCALEDYLELRPEKRGVVERLVKEGKLLIGPLYTQPDEALVSPEALVRNFLIGIREASAFGRVMKIGYLPDTFGHTAQLPQILRGFGIDSFFFTRGLGDEEDELGTEFIWEAPDGSRVIAVHLRKGYCNANMLGVSDPYSALIWRAPEGWYTVFLNLYYGEPEPDMDRARRSVEELASFLGPKTPSGNLLLMNGCDHQPPQARITHIVDHLNALGLGYKFEIGTLEEYLELVRPLVKRLKVFRGEMRGAKSHPLLANVLSTRAYLKKLNYRAQLLLEKYAEPLSTIAWLYGLPYPERLLLMAWKLLLKNHAHDSIYGSGSDPVHVDNESRFYQVIGIASGVTYDAARYLAEKLGYGGGGKSVFIFNPSGWPRSDVVLVLLPVEKVERGLVAVDWRGRKLPVQLLERSLFWYGMGLAAFIARDVPPLGFATYRLEEGETEAVKRDSGRVIENEYFRVEVDPERGGALRVFDKEAGVVYEGLNVYVDEGDAGDEYNYSPPRDGDLVVESTSFKASVEREVGPVASILRIRVEMEVPERIEGGSRSSRRVALPVETEVYLYRGVRRIDIKTRVFNRALDHRFRVRFPTGIKADRVSADSHFYVVERSVKPASDGKGWVEVPPRVHPQLYWVDVSDGKRGFMVANRGMPEYEAKEEDGCVSLYVTLFRSVGWLSRDDLQSRKGHAGPPIPTPGAQCIGEMVFEYSLIPHSGTWLTSKAYMEARNFAEPLLSLPAAALELTAKRVVSVRPESLVVTALKRSEDGSGIILRFYNITGSEVEGTVELSFNAEAWLTTLAEEPVEWIGEGKLLKLKVGPHKICTLLLKPTP